MATQTTDVETAAQELAHRLRLIQLDFSEGPADERREYLSEEIGRSLRGLTPGQRPQLLDRLKSHFPSWDADMDVATDGASKAPRSASDEDDLRDASFLVTRLVEASKGMSDGERQVVRDRLVAAGLADAAPKLAWRDDATEELIKMLEAKGEDDLDPQRALSVVDLMVSCIMGLNRLSIRTWQEMAPKEKTMEPGKLGRDLSRYFAGDPDVSREQVAEDLERTRTLVASLVFAIKNAPREWAHRFLERFSEAAITGSVTAEGGVKFLDNKDKRCWDKYKQLAADLDQVSLSQEILDVVAEFATRIRESGRF